VAKAISRQSWQNYIDQNTGYDKARQAALKAIALDPTYAPGYRELADIKLYHDFDWLGAKEDYQMANGLEPADADVLTDRKKLFIDGKASTGINRNGKGKPGDF